MEKKIEKEIEFLKDGESYAYELVESAMRLNIFGVAIDRLSDIEENLEFSEEDLEEFINDIDYMGEAAYNVFAESLDLMDWETKIGKAIF